MTPAELKLAGIISFFGMLILFPFFQVAWVRIIRSYHRNDQRSPNLEICICILFAIVCLVSLAEGWGTPLGAAAISFLFIGISTCLSVSVKALYEEKE